MQHCDYEELKINKSEEHSRVFVKIQDGCDRYCTYCIIPYVRGNLRSRKPEDVVEEIKEIAANGYREVVITGIHLSSYGKDFLKDGKPSLDYSGNADYLTVAFCQSCNNTILIYCCYIRVCTSVHNIR